MMETLRERLRRAAIRALAAPLHAKHAIAARGFALTDNERRLLALRARHRGERVVVIGDGASLARTRLELLAGETCLAIEGAHAAAAGIRPTYVVVEDRRFAVDHATALAALGETTVLAPEDLRLSRRGGDETVFVRYARADDTGDAPGFVDPTRLVFHDGGGASYLALQLAYYLGFRDVFVIGLDLDAGARDPAVGRQRRAFAEARRVFEAGGRRLMNATVGGFLEELPRISLAEALRRP